MSGEERRAHRAELVAVMASLQVEPVHISQLTPGSPRAIEHYCELLAQQEDES